MFARRTSKSSSMGRCRTKPMRIQIGSGTPLAQSLTSSDELQKHFRSGERGSQLFSFHVVAKKCAGCVREPQSRRRSVADGSARLAGAQSRTSCSRTCSSRASYGWSVARPGLHPSSRPRSTFDCLLPLHLMRQTDRVRDRDGGSRYSDCIRMSHRLRFVCRLSDFC